MDKGYEKEKFITIGIKASVVRKFRRFARRSSKSQSMTLLLMMEFFERHGLSPEQRLGDTIDGLTLLMKRRFNAIIAIIRNIEKQQTLPTLGMLQALFEQELASDNVDWEDEPDFIEKRFLEIQDSGLDEMSPSELAVPKIRYDRLQEERDELQADLAYILAHVSEVNPPLGKPYLRLNLEFGTIEKYRRKLKKS